MFARKIDCRVLESVWATPTVLRLRFVPAKPFHYEAGQYANVVVPCQDSGTGTIRRSYSLVASPEEAKENGYELLVKYVPGEKGSEYLKGLRPKEKFEIFAPQGDFKYEVPSPGRSVCFIATGTGIGPIRAMVLSEKYLQNPPPKAFCLMGQRNEDEILYRKVLESVGVEVAYALAAPSAKWKGFRGSVLDYLKQMPAGWPWRSTDFYVSGTSPMVEQVASFLRGAVGVSTHAIHTEVMSPLRGRQIEIRLAPSRVFSIAIPHFGKEMA